MSGRSLTIRDFMMAADNVKEVGKFLSVLEIHRSSLPNEVVAMLNRIYPAARSVDGFIGRLLEGEVKVRASS